MQEREAEDDAEVWLVLWVCGGLFVLRSVLGLLGLWGGSVSVASTERFVRTLAPEALLAVGFVPFLRVRGWRVARATEPWQWLDPPRAVALLAVVYLVLAIPALLAARLHMVGDLFHLAGVRPPWITIAAVALLNPLFEEFLYLGYAVTALRRHGVWLAAAISIGLRTAIHVYQGWSAIFFALPVGVVFTLYYIRTRRIWPVVIAHAVLDALALIFMNHHFR